MGKRDSAKSVPEKIRVAIVEDDAGLRSALDRLFRSAPDFQVIALCPDAAAALRQVPALRPDVVIMDVGLPDMTGIECVRLLKSQMPDTRAVMLTVYDDSDTLFQALMAGADGYLVKRTAGRRILDAVREIAAGGAPMSPQVARRMVEYFHNIRADAPAGATDPAGEALGVLTEQEHLILSRLAGGLVPKEVAAELGISWETVRKHLANIYQKLHVHSRTEAVLKFLGHRLTPPGGPENA